MKNDLTTTLRKLIREEVEKAVRTEFVNFVSLMGEANTSKNKVVKPKPKKKVSESSIKKMVNDIVAEPNQVPQKKLSNNPVLNEILNKTEGGMPTDPSMLTQQEQPVPQGQEEYPTMGGGTFDRSRMAEMLGYGGETPQAQTQGMTTPDGAPIQGVPENVSNAMTRNYGDLMKAIDKKKNGGPLKG